MSRTTNLNSWLSSFFGSKPPIEAAKAPSGDQFGHAAPRPPFLPKDVQEGIAANFQIPQADRFACTTEPSSIRDKAEWKGTICESMERLSQLSSQLSRLPSALATAPLGLAAPKEALRLVLSHLEGEVATLRIAINEAEHNKASANVLWTLFTEFSRIRDATQENLRDNEFLDERLVQRHHDLLNARTKVHFDALDDDISSQVREICHNSTRKIHFVLAHTCLPLPGVDGEPQERLETFFHSVENLIAGLSDWILSGEQECDSKATMYLDVIDSVQRANIVDLRAQDYSSFITRINHLQDFLDVIIDKVPVDLIEAFEKECTAHAEPHIRASHFKDEIEEVLALLDTVPVPDHLELKTQDVMTTLLGLELPLQFLDDNAADSPSVSDLIVEVGDAICGLQVILNTPEYNQNRRSGKL